MSRASRVKASLAERQAQNWQRVHDALDHLLAAFHPGVAPDVLVTPVLSLGIALTEVGVFPNQSERPTLLAAAYMRAALMAACRSGIVTGVEQAVRSILSEIVRLEPDDGIADGLTWINQFVTDQAPPTKKRRAPTRKAKPRAIPLEYQRAMALLPRFESIVKERKQRFFVRKFSDWLELRHGVYLPDYRKFGKWLKNHKRVIRRQKTGR